MGVIGGRLGYQLLKSISPQRKAGYRTATAYAHKSKLVTLLGAELLERMKGKVAIDFGCGLGKEAVEMAHHARRVIGVDIRDTLLTRARARADAAGVADRCTFSTSPTELADIVVSLDSFEHFEDPADVLRIMAEYLRPDGEVFASFGPIWYHPLGGHTFSVFPWSHLVFTEPALLRWRKDFRPAQTATRITECGLNKMTIRRFQRLVEESPFRFAQFEARPIRPLRWFANGLTREFATSVVTCRLVRRDAARSTSNANDLLRCES